MLRIVKGRYWGNADAWGVGMQVQGRQADDRAVLAASSSGEAPAALPLRLVGGTGASRSTRAPAALWTPARRQAFRFCVVGLLGTLVNLAVYGVLVAETGIVPLLAAIGGFVVAVTHNHLLNRVWTFGARRARYLPQGARFLVISLAALAINLAVLRALLAAGLGHLPAQVLGIGAATPAGFLGNRAWTFGGRT
jgi:putative flippase GtrA